MACGRLAVAIGIIGLAIAGLEVWNRVAADQPGYSRGQAGSRARIA